MPIHSTVKLTCNPSSAQQFGRNYGEQGDYGGRRSPKCRPRKVLLRSNKPKRWPNSPRSAILADQRKNSSKRKISRHVFGEAV